MKAACDGAYNKASTQYLNGCVSDMMQEALGKAYMAMKKLGARLGDMDQKDGFTLTIFHKSVSSMHPSMLQACQII